MIYTGKLKHCLLALAGVVFLLSLYAQPVKKDNSFLSSFVTISKSNPYYFELSNGQPYIPVGANLCWAKSPEVMETYFKNLSENGGNYARIWLNYPAHEVETKYGTVDSANLKYLDRIIEYAVKYNIKVKLCIESFRRITAKPDFFSKSQYHLDKGGPFADMTEYINSEKGRMAYLNRLKILQKRYGNHPAIFGWELWNEMNAIESKGLWEWNEWMLPEVHKMFPKNMVMQSLGSFDNEKARMDYRFINQLPINDVAQIHRYLDMGASMDICKAPMDILAGNAIEELRSYNIEKPMLLAEVGGVKPKHTGPIDLYAKDVDGTLLHDLLFAPFFSGAAGPGHAWHWDSYIARNNLWYHFSRFNQSIKGINPVAEHFVPVKIMQEKLQLYVLVGRKNILVWCRDLENTWENELVKDNPPSIRKGIILDLSSLLSSKALKSISTYDPWKNEWTSQKKENGVLLPDFKRSIVLKVEKK